jgi:hypothetical protein
MVNKIEPTHIMQCGDLLDFYAFSKYPRSLSVAPMDEVTKGLAVATEFWETLRKLAPAAKCFQLLGNHCVRMTKRIAERLPELEDFVTPFGLYKFDGVTTLKSDRDHLEIGGVIYTHGFLSKSIDHAKYFNKPVVHGHSHSASIIYERPELWSMSCGYLADPHSLPLSYTRTKLIKWTTASGLIVNGKPRLIIL